MFVGQGIGGRNRFESVARELPFLGSKVDAAPGAPERRSCEAVLRLVELAFRNPAPLLQAIRSRREEKHVKPVSEVSDVFQDTFCEALCTTRLFLGSSLDDLERWILEIAKRRIDTEARRERRRRRAILLVSLTEDMDVAICEVGPGEVLDREEVHSQLVAAIDELPERFRAVARMHWLEDQPVKQLANALGSTQAETSKRLHYARKRLVVMMERRAAHETGRRS